MLVTKDNYADFVLEKFPQFHDEFVKDESFYRDILYTFTFTFLYNHIDVLLKSKKRKKKEIMYFFETMEYLQRNGDRFIDELIHVEIYINLFYDYGLKLQKVLGSYVGDKGSESIKLILDWNERRNSQSDK